MDEPAKQPASKGSAVLLDVALLTLAAQQAYGDDGLRAVLVLAVGALALAGFHRLSGRSWAGVPEWRREPEQAPPTKADTWRSERWVREAVQRGLRSLDEWRFDQQAT